MSSSNAEKRPSQTEVTNGLMKVDGGRSGTGYSDTRKRTTSGQFKTNPSFALFYLYKNWRIPLIFGFSAIVFAIAFVGLALVLAGSQRSEASDTPRKKVVFVEKETKVESVQVLVPVREIRKGEKLDAQLFTVVERPKLSVPFSTVASSDQLRGAYAKATLIKDQPVSTEMVQSSRSQNPVIASIQPGYRAVAINVNATSSVEGWATAGAFVDVQWVSADVRGEKTATLIAQNAKILSAERQIDDKAQGAPVPTTITLMVADKDAKRISLASNFGQLILLLRGMEDANKGSTELTLTLKDLYNSTKEPRGGSVRLKNRDGSVQQISVIDGRIVKDA